MPKVRSLPQFVPLLVVAAILTGPSPAASAPPAPGEGKLDWVRLVSGEWLAGEIKSMRNEKIEFDSEKLDLLKLDWEDILELRSQRTLTYVFTESRVAIGSATFQDSTIRVRQDGAVQEFLSRELVSIVAGEGRELDFWSGNASLGFVGRSGNTDQVDFNVMAFVRRDGTRTRLDMRYASNFGEIEGARNVNNQLGSGRVDVYLSRLLFVTPLSLELYSDEFQNVDLRTSVSAGAGVYLVRQDKLDWFLQVGAGYVATRYGSVAAGEDADESSGTLIPSTTLEWEPAKDLKLNVDYNVKLNVPDVEKMFHHFVAMLTIENLKVVDLTTSITWDHVAEPKPRSDGSVPGKNDLRTTFGIGIDF